MKLGSRSAATDSILMVSGEETGTDREKPGKIGLFHVFDLYFRETGAYLGFDFSENEKAKERDCGHADQCSRLL